MNSRLALFVLLLTPGFARSATTDVSPKPIVVLERSVDKAVTEFPAAVDLSTPEGACVAWQRANASKDATAISQLSWVKIDPTAQEKWYQREQSRDAAGLAVYLKALSDSRVVQVQTWRDDLANVVTFLPFPDGTGRNPYSSRTFGRIGNEWKNLGEDRLPDAESARQSFTKKKEVLWQRFLEVKQQVAAETAELVKKLQDSEPLISAVREDWTAAYQAVAEQNATNALACLRKLVPHVEQFRARVSGTELEPSVKSALDQFSSVTRALEQGNLQTASTLMQSLGELGQRIDERIQVIKRSQPPSPAP